MVDHKLGKWTVCPPTLLLFDCPVQPALAPALLSLEARVERIKPNIQSVLITLSGVNGFHFTLKKCISFFSRWYFFYSLCDMFGLQKSWIIPDEYEKEP